MLDLWKKIDDDGYGHDVMNDGRTLRGICWMSGGTMSDVCRVYRVYHEMVLGGRVFVRGPRDAPSLVDKRASSSIESGCVVVLGGRLSPSEIAHEADVWVWLVWLWW